MDSQLDGRSTIDLGRLEPQFSRWLVLGILVVPAVIFSFASYGNWLFDMGGADNWQYVKYFQSWDTADSAMRAAMDRDYKGSRVPWIILGFAAHATLGPDLGSIALHLSVLLLSAFFLYGTAKPFFGPRIALLTGLVAMAFPAFQSSGVSGFWNYHGAAANLYFLAGLYFLVRSFASADKAGWATLAGACLFSALLTTFIYGAMAPMLLAFAWTCWRRFGPQPLIRLLLAALAGAMLITLLYALASFLTGGRFLFFRSQFAFIARAAGANPWVEPLSAWLPQAGWISTVLVTALCSLAFLPGTRRNVTPAAGLARAFVLQFWLAELALLALDLLGQNAFQVTYIHYITVPCALLALAGMAAVLFGSRLQTVPLLRIVVLAVVILVPLQVLADATIRQALRFDPLPRFVLPSLSALAFVAIAVLLRRHRHAGFVALAAFPVLAVQVYPAGPYALLQTCYPARAIFPMIAEASAYVSAYGATQTTGAMWYPDNEAVVWKHDCPTIALGQLGFEVRHAGLVRPLGEPAMLPLDAVREARPTQLRTFFILSRADSAMTHRAALEALAESFEAMPAVLLTQGLEEPLSLQAYRRRD